MSRLPHKFLVLAVSSKHTAQNIEGAVKKALTPHRHARVHDSRKHSDLPALDTKWIMLVDMYRFLVVWLHQQAPGTQQQRRRTSTHAHQPLQRLELDLL